jgi:mannose-6-phosphate isomerase-like protein (cupin superfamily)
MSHTIISLDDVEDSAPKFGFEGVHEARFAHGALEAERTGVSFFRVLPGVRQPFGHRHDDAEEVYVVIGGSGRVKLDDHVHEVKALDAIRVSPETMRCFEAGPDGLEYLAMGQHHPGDGEIVPGWWSD